MASIALIGPDGAGKTTLCRMLERDSGLRFKYMYMGVNVDASNVALPTTRFAHWVKRLMKKRGAIKGPANSTSRSINGRGSLRSTARVVNLLADEWYRQMIARWYQHKGYLIICDRHYVFDFSRHLRVDGSDRLPVRVHRFLLEKLYPKPDLVIYLDAPATVLYARKKEGTLESLEARRQAFLRHGSTMPGFVRVDANRQLSLVYRDVLRAIRSLTDGSRAGRGTAWNWVSRRC